MLHCQTMTFLRRDMTKQNQYTGHCNEMKEVILGL